MSNRHLSCPNCGEEFAAPLPATGPLNADGSQEPGTTPDGEPQAAKTKEPPMDVQGHPGQIRGAAGARRKGGLRVQRDPRGREDRPRVNRPRAADRRVAPDQLRRDRQGRRDVTAEGFELVAKSFQALAERVNEMPLGRRSHAAAFRRAQAGRRSRNSRSERPRPTTTTCSSRGRARRGRRPDRRSEGPQRGALRHPLRPPPPTPPEPERDTEPPWPDSSTPRRSTCPTSRRRSTPPRPPAAAGPRKPHHQGRHEGHAAAQAVERVPANGLTHEYTQRTSLGSPSSSFYADGALPRTATPATCARASRSSASARSAASPA
jgi:hypothetical protein